MTATGFDSIASAYQSQWTDTPAGHLQRAAVWHYLRRLFAPGDHILDLGCGTGDDALMLAARGVRVTGIDNSAGMVQVAARRGVDARICRIQNVDELGLTFDGALSNFGAMNCVESSAHLREPFARVVKPGGWLAICVMNRVCIRETFWYAGRGEFAKAVRRWKGGAVSSLVPRVFYPTAGKLRRAFAPDFTLVSSHGIGVAVPPSCVKGSSFEDVQRTAAFDERFASWPVVRSLGDHRLLIFRRRANR